MCCVVNRSRLVLSGIGIVLMSADASATRKPQPRGRRGGEQMCIKRKCKYCGEVFTHKNIAVTVCDNPVCKAQSHGTIRTKEILCKTCGKPVPFGSGRYRYCSDECQKIGGAELSRQYYRTHSITRIGCFMDCKAEVIYKPLGEVKI